MLIHGGQCQKRAHTYNKQQILSDVIIDFLFNVGNAAISLRRITVFLYRTLSDLICLMKANNNSVKLLEHEQRDVGVRKFSLSEC